MTDRLDSKDAHRIVGDALVSSEDDQYALHDIPFAVLNDDERSSLKSALRQLHELDRQLAERTGVEPYDRPWRQSWEGKGNE